METDGLEKIKRSELAQHLLSLSKGFLTMTADVALYWLFFSLELTSAGRSTLGVSQAAQAASHQVDGIGYEALQRSFYYLQHKGLINSLKDKMSEKVITQEGIKRLRQKLPIYLTERPWDERIYLVTYDIPEKKRYQRDALRDFLRRLGCETLQQSVWVAVYDPREILRRWAQERDFEEQVIVSDVGRDGSIAGKTIPELVAELYDLSFADEQYRHFITRYEKIDPEEVDQWQLNLDWAFCVELDPQLPPELLPAGFSGHRAYKLYQKLARANLQELFKGTETDPWEQNQQKHLREKIRESHEADLILGLRYTRSDFVEDLNYELHSRP